MNLKILSIAIMLLSAASIACPGCVEQDAGSVNDCPVSGTGTILLIDLEGGFYAIIHDDGRQFLPDELPSAMKIDGLRIEFTGRIREDIASIEMWGIPVQICYMHPLPGVKPVLEYERTGGIAGFDDRLILFTDLTIVVDRSGGIFQHTLDADTVADLESLFTEAEFSSLNTSYPAPVPGADYFTYSIMFDNHTVVTEDTGVPDALEPIIRELNSLLSPPSS